MSANNSDHLQPPDESKSFSADKFLAVVDGVEHDKVRFIGTRDECMKYMAENLIPPADMNLDLRYIKDGQLWRMSSWILRES